MTHTELTAIRERLGLGPVDMGRAMGVSYTTYRDWQSGKNRMPAVAVRCAEMLAEMDKDDIDYWIWWTKTAERLRMAE